MLKSEFRSERLRPSAGAERSLGSLFHYLGILLPLVGNSTKRWEKAFTSETNDKIPSLVKTFCQFDKMYSLVKGFCHLSH